MPTSSLTTYDTGARLEPQPWSHDGYPDRYGRVDFDDDEGATIVSAHVTRLPSGAYALCLTRVSDAHLVVYVDGERSVLVREGVPNQEEN